MIPVNRDQAYLLCLFDYKATTGFATVSTNIVAEMRRRFADRLRLDIIPINYFGDESGIHEDEFTRILPITQGELAHDPYGRFPFLQRLNNGDYTGIFIIQDPGIAVGMMPNLIEIDQHRHEAGRKRIKRIFYFPVDSTPLDIFFQHDKVHSLDYFDRLVTYTSYGRQEVLKKRPSWKDKLHVIPHGVNIQDFYEMDPDQVAAFRTSYFGHNAGKIIIANVNRNQFRKDIPSTLFGIDRFLKDHPEFKNKIFLYLHMFPKDHMGWDIRQIADQLGWIENTDYGFPPESQQNHGADIDTMRGIYNASNFYITTTTGEGWGLTVVEAMACGCPVIAPNITSLIEIGADGSRLWPLEADYPYCSRYDNVIRSQCNMHDISETLETAIGSPDKTMQKAEEAFNYALSLNWKNVCDRWEAMFGEVYF